MNEVLENSNSNVYIKVDISDNLNEQSNKITIDMDFIDSTQNTESVTLFCHFVSKYLNLKFADAISVYLPAIGNLIVGVNEQDPLKASVTLAEMGTGTIISAIELSLVYAENGSKILSVVSKSSLITFLTSIGVEQIMNQIIEYECISKLYEELYKSEFEEAENKEYITINSYGKSFDEIKDFLYFSGILNKDGIKNIYVEADDGIYKILKTDSSEFKEIENELHRRGYLGRYVSGGSNFETLYELNEPNSITNEERQCINDYINDLGFTYKDNKYILIKNDLFTYPLIGNIYDNIIYGDNVERLLYGDQGNDFIQAGSKNDEIYGDKSYWGNANKPGNDTLLGGLGNDKIYGEDGNDILIGDTANYTEEELLSFNDIILANNGHIDIEKFESENDGADTIWGGSGNDIIIGGGGNDELYGESGNDIIHGGTGDDTISGGDGEDDLYGDDGNDYIDGGNGNDIIHGSNEYNENPNYNEKNILIGGKGKDTIYGGYGDDVIIAGSPNANLNTIDVKNLINHKDNIDTENFEADNNCNEIEGNDGNDLIIGDKGKDIIHGGNGNDYIYGGNGKDELYGDDNDDYLNGGIGDDYLYGGAGNDVLVGDEGSDVLYGGSDDDVLIAGNTSLSNDSLKNLQAIKDSIDTNAYVSQQGADSKLYGESGNDLLIGDKGNDYLSGGSGHDYIYGGDGNDILYGDSGNDTLKGGNGNDKLYGGNGNDQLYGGDGNDILVAGSGTDYLYGENGNDVLCNYEGYGYLNGGSGYDSYNVSRKSSAEITDFREKLNNIVMQHGSVSLDGLGLDGASKEYYKGGNVWYREDIDVRYVWSGDTLIINGNIRINDFKNLDLGIYLEYPEEEPEDDDGAETDPILFDLNGDGIQTTSTPYQGRNYDYNNDGFAEKIAWAANGDGVLVCDTNNDGQIQGSSDIVLTSTLCEYDTNEDGVIDANDDNFNNLKIMKVDGSILSMEEAGIASINITNINNRTYVDENGNTRTATGSYTTTDGNIYEYGEYYLKTDSKLSIELNKLEETEAVSLLPDIANSGTVRSLHQAMLRDEGLQTLVSAFTTETNDEARMNLVEQILLKWTGTENVEDGSRGEYIDAKSLAILEAFDGKGFYSTYEASVGNPNPENPNKEAANILRTQYEVLKNEIYANLMQQTHLQTYYDAIDTTEIKWNLSPVVALLQTAIEQNESTGKDLVYQVAKMIKGLGIDNYSNFFDPKDDSCFYTTFTKDDRELKWLIDTVNKLPYYDEIGDNQGSAADDSYRLEEQGHFHALSGDDVAYGSNEGDSFAMCNGDDLVDGGDGDDILDTQGGNDIIFGGAGNDTVHAGDGDDIIFGGDGDDVIYPDHADDYNCYNTGNDIIRGDKGNDTIFSERGDDTFIFNLGDGQDTVYESQGVDTFYFGNGITWDDLIFEQSGNDMIVKINNTTDQITVKDWFLADEYGTYRYDNHKIEIFEFADGSKHYKDEITVGNNTEAITYNMEEIGDYVETASGYKTVVNIKEGWNDIVAGQNSNDTYVIDKQGSNIRIQDYSGTDTIKFGEGITLASTFFAYNPDCIEVWFEDYDSYIRIIGSGSNFTKFEFADGTVITDLSNYVERNISYVDHIMGERERELTLLGYESIYVTGNDMDNRIIANEGDSIINAGRGNDAIESTLGGNNTYIINLNDGNDHIIDVGGNDTIQFGEGITIENTNFLKNLENNNLEIWFSVEDGSDNWITIENFFGSEENKIENFVFADGSIITDVEGYINAYGSREDGETLELPDDIREGHIRGQADTTAIGNDMDNHMNGGQGDNTFIGGKGNDFYWDDQGGNDRFVYNIGDGHDGIANFGGLDAVIFGEGITKENIRFVQNADSLLIWFDGIPDSTLNIENYYTDPNAKVELFKFADGSVIDDITPYIVEKYSRDEDVVLPDGYLAGGVWDDRNLNVTGNDDDNLLGGNAGNNIMEGKGGNDNYYDDQGGDDTYIYNIGDGYDSIYDYNGNDKIKFGEGITPDDLVCNIHHGHLVISFKNFDGRIFVENYDADENNKIEILEFADGTQITDVTPYLESTIVDSDYTLAENSQIRNIHFVGENTATIKGNSNNNDIVINDNAEVTVQGKEGDDTLIDEAGGSTTYIYNVGDGADYIYDENGTDKIKFGEGINSNNLKCDKDGDHLVVFFDGIDGSIVIENYFGSDDNKIEIFEFADGTQITDISPYLISTDSDVDYTLAENSQYDDVRLVGENNINLTGNSSDNYLQGNDGDNIIESNGGNDIINGMGGNDILRDSVGGNTTYWYSIGHGDDVIEDVGGTDTIVFNDDRINSDNLRFVQRGNNLVIYVDGEEGSLAIKDYFTSDNNKIENFKFDDGTTFTDFTPYLSGVKSDENYTFAEETIINEVELTGNENLNVVGNSQDNYIVGNAGNNTIQANGGDDVIVDTAGGNDTYIYNLGDGYDEILDLGGTDKIKFGEGITTENLRFIQGVNHLIVAFTDNDGQILINNYMNNIDNRIEIFELADGTQITDITPYLIGEKATGNYTFTDNSQIEVVRVASEENTTVTGNSNDNTVILADTNEHTVNTKGGNDYVLDLEGGNTTYIYNIGDGFDYISDFGGVDTVKFGEGLTLEKMGCLNQHGRNLEIFFDDVEGNFVIEDYFTNEENRIERFEFADGTVIEDITPYLRAYGSEESIILDGEYREAHLWGSGNTYALGTSADEHFNGNEGDNTFAGGGGDDSFYDDHNTNETYIYNINNGHDHIHDVGGVDRIIFGQEIYASSTRFERIENNLEISFYDREGGITIQNYFLNDDYKIEYFEFYDGEVLTDITDRLKGIAPNENYVLPEDSDVENIRMNGDGNISVTGNSSDNYIEGNSGNNTFEGKGGNDVLVDYAGGDDTYIYNIGDGYDVIEDIGGYDTIRFGSEVTLENLAFMKTETDLNIWFHNIENDGLSIRDYFSNPEKKIERFELADGTVITDITNYITGIGSEDNIVLPEGVSQAHLWGQNNTSATGNDMDNWMGGNEGDNTVTGGKGNDYLYDDQGGNDTYVYNLGDGWDCINDWGGYDTIKFGENISVQNLVFMRNEGDLLIQFRDNNGEYVEGEIRIESYFYDDNKRIERIEFADGSTIENFENRITQLVGENDMQNHWGYSEVHVWGDGDVNVTGSYSDEIIYSNSGNNYIDPQGGNDRIYDTNGGDDTYIYNSDYNNKYIVDIGGNDTIKFGSGLNTENTFFSKENDNLLIHFPHTGESIIQIENYFANDDNKIERFEFSDGTVITDVSNLITGLASTGDVWLEANQIYAHLLGDGDTKYVGNDAEHNQVYGNSGNNTYDGKGGHDHIVDKEGGNDTYLYNLGYGSYYIVDIGGDDTIKFGEGISLNNVRFAHRGNDLQISIDSDNGNGGYITVENYFRSDIRKIENIEFADGTIITDVTPYISGISVNTDYTIQEDSIVKDLYIQGSNNVSVVGDSRDNHFEGNNANNTYQGNGGNDDVYDEAGDDTYIYNLGDGNDFYNDNGGNDTLRLGEGITQDIIKMERYDDGSLHIYFEGYDGGVTIYQHFGDENKRLEKIVLADGTEITNFAPFMTYVEVDSNYTLPENGNKRDVIVQGGNDITINGNSQDNYVEINTSGAVTVQGNGGNDYVNDTTGGNTTYIFNKGDGWNTINDIGGYDTVKFGEGLNVSDMKVMNRNGNGLEIWFDGVEGNLVIENCLENSDYGIERFEFADGTVITDISQYLNCIASEGNVVLPDGYKEAHLWGNGNTSATGNDDNNQLNGNSGNNTFQGGKGNDNHWDDQGGDDTFIYNVGDGYDHIGNYGGYDVIRFGENITPSMLTMNRHEDGGLEIKIGDNGDGIKIQNYFSDDEWKIEKLIFADGTEITDFTPYFNFIETSESYTLTENSSSNDVYASGNGDISLTGNSQNNWLVGNSGNNVFEGKGGDDSIRDYAGGDDTYIYNLGDGWDNISDVGGNDKIQFGAGITLDSLGFMKDDYNNMHIRLSDGCEIFINGQYDNEENQIEQLVFADNTVVSNLNSLTNQIGSEFHNIVLPEGYKEAHLWNNANLNAVGNDLDNFIRGNSGNNILEGKGGNDTYWEEEGGDDTYIYNVGDCHDSISDAGGNDTIRFGAGITSSNINFAHQQYDYNNLEITFDNIEGSIIVNNYFADDARKIENFVFNDGTTITDISSYLGIETGSEIDPIEPTFPYEEYEEEEPPTLPTEPIVEEEVPTLSNGVDVNLLIQEMNSFGVDNEVVLTGSEVQNPDEILLTMVS